MRTRFLLLLLFTGLFITCCSPTKKQTKTIVDNDKLETNKNEGFKPSTETSLTDIDGNEYPVVQIGNKLWMASNLQVSKYNNGTPILAYSGGGFLQPEEKGMFSIYDNETANELKFGKLYNFYAVAEDCLCPEGWQVPTDEDWQAMIKNQGQEKLNLLFGGSMNPQNIPPFTELNTTGYWWTTTSVGRNAIATYELHLDKSNLQRNGANEESFLSVRCVKNI